MDTVLYAPLQPDLAALERYMQLKAHFAELLRREQLLFDAQQAAPELQDGLATLFATLAADHFKLAVLGQFKRGKSSLMNAVLGRQLLPTGILPLTSVVTTVQYGPAAKAIIEKEGLLLPKEIAFAELPQYITEKGNPSNVQKVKKAMLELPLAFLRRGVQFIDTPGIGSAIAANTAATYDFLPQCDGAIFVTGADAPLNSTELSFLQEVVAYAPQIFFVINKIDTVPAAQRTELGEFCAAAVERTLGRAQSIFAVSAQQGLEAKLTEDSAEYAVSGIKSFEEALASFLATQRSRIVLLKLVRQASEFLAQLEAPAVAELTKLQEELHELQLILQDEKNLPPAQIIMPSSPQLEEQLIQKLVPKTMPEQAWQTTGCPVCQHLSDLSFNFFRQWQYTLEKDAAAQQEFVASGGYCQLHTWQFINLLSPYAASLAYSALTQNIVLQLQQRLAKQENTLAGLAMDKEHCPICQMLRQAEQDYLVDLAKQLSTAAGQQRYLQSQGICLHHLQQLLQLVDVQLRPQLLEHAAAYLAQTVEDMQSFALKHEAIAHKRENIEEKDAYYRAAVHLVGSAKICL